jgi:hypothetical protein
VKYSLERPGIAGADARNQDLLIDAIGAVRQYWRAGERQGARAVCGF